MRLDWLSLLGSCVVAWSGDAVASPTVAMNSHLPSDSDLAAVAAVGAQAARMDFNWHQFNPAQGTFTWDAVDAAVASARAHHVAIYATVAYTPKWASSVPTCTPDSTDDAANCNNKVPAQTSDWTTAVTNVVTRYAGQIDCWGIWNEPNLRTFFDGTQDQFVNVIFTPAAAAIRAADPRGRICGPELSGLTASSNWNGKSGTCIGSNCIRNGWEIDLAQMLDRVGSQIDVVTQHMYKSDAAGVMTSLLDGEYFGSLLTHDAVKHVISQHGAGDKEFWLTESGWTIDPKDPSSLASAATNIVDLYAHQDEVCAGTYAPSSADPWSQWTRTYFYDFQSIVGPNDTPLAPYTALQGWTSGHTTSPCGAAPSADGGAPGESDGGSGGARDASAAADGSTGGGGSLGNAPDSGTDAPGANGGCACGAGRTAGGPGALAAASLVVAALWRSAGRRRRRARG